MNITINASGNSNVTITGNENLISNDTTFGELLTILRTRPEAAEASKTEQAEKKREEDDSRGAYKDLFSEIYAGPLFISDRILLSHEPVYGLPWCLNIHGHDHNGTEAYAEGCKHINLAANVCGYTPMNLGKMIKAGVLADIESIHRQTIDRAAEKKQKKLEAILDA